jgi:hypothetical protein
MTAPFIVFSLPRSRSAWTARFLSYREKRCGHDIATQCRTVKEFVDLLGNEYAGTAETGAVIGWRAIRKLRPDVRIAVIRRPVQEVYDSLARFGLGSPQLMSELRERDALLDQVARLPGVRSFAFHDLNGVTACQGLFEFCLGIPFDWEWWESLASVNVQVEVAERIQYLIDNHDRIEAIKRDAKRIAGDGIVIGPESWESLWPEIDVLFAEHFREVDGGDEPQRPYRLDEPAMRAMNASGQLRIFTARVSGSLAGYCMWQVSKDVESAGATFAEHGPWFVRPCFARLMLGLKLFDASLDDLRALGVRTAYPHHRLHGRGAKLGAFFRRRGAVEIQRTYSLPLGEAHA